MVRELANGPAAGAVGVSSCASDKPAMAARIARERLGNLIE
jgi:hypothetical protein